MMHFNVAFQFYLLPLPCLFVSGPMRATRASSSLVTLTCELLYAVSFAFLDLAPQYTVT